MTRLAARRFAPLLAILGLGLLAAVPARADGRLYRFGGDSALPPYEFVRDGKAVGFNVELLEAIAEVMGISVEVRLGEWAAVRKDLEAGRIDGITGMIYSKARSAAVDFSAPHSTAYATLFVRSGSAIRGYEDARGKAILVEKADIMHDFLLEAPFASEILPAVNHRAALRRLASGEGDAVLLFSKLEGIYFIKELGLPGLRAVDTRIPPFQYCFAVRKGEAGLLDVLNEGLAVVKLNGQYRAIYDKWFGFYEKDALQSASRKAVIAAACVAALFVLVLLWSYSLRRQVGRKTAELRAYRESLEEKVRQRTAELLRANELQRESVVALQKSVEANAALLHELQHRIKNSLAIICGLIDLERARGEGGSSGESLEYVRNRVQSLASLYDLLFRSDEVRQVRLDLYLSDLCGFLGEGYGLGGRIRMETELEPFGIDVKSAIHIGLIANELVTNAIKYAFPDGRPGSIRLSLRVDGGACVIAISDDGVGVHEGPPQAGRESGGLGMELVRMLCDQIRAARDFTSGASGTSFTMRIPIPADGQPA